MASPIPLTASANPVQPVPAAVQPRDGAAAAFAAALDQAPLVAAGPRLSALDMTMNTRTEAQTRAAIHKSAGDFEASCFGQLMGFMTQEIAVDPIFGGGRGEEMYRDMMNTEYGKLAHKSGAMGLAAQVEGELLRAQGLKPLPGTPAVTRTSLKV